MQRTCQIILGKCILPIAFWESARIIKNMNSANTFQVLDGNGDKCGTVIDHGNDTYTAYTLSDIEVYTGESYEVALWAVREGAYL